MGPVVFLAIALKLGLLVLNKLCIYSFQFINLKIKTVNHTLEFTDITICLIYFDLGLISVLHSLVQLIIHTVWSFNEGLSLLVKHSDSCILSKTFLLPFWKCSIILINGALLSLSQFLILSYRVFNIFVFSFYSLVMHNCALNIILEISQIRFFLRNFNSNFLSLLLDFTTFIISIIILLLENMKLVSQAFNYVRLTLNLSIVVSLESSDTDFQSFSSSLKICYLLLQTVKISIV